MDMIIRMAFTKQEKPVSPRSPRFGVAQFGKAKFGTKKKQPKPIANPTKQIKPATTFTKQTKP